MGLAWLVLALCWGLLDLLGAAPIHAEGVPPQYRYLIPLVVLSSNQKGSTSDDCVSNDTFGVRFFHNWKAVVPPCPTSAGVPMVWGMDVPAEVSASDYLLLFNECERADQCNASPRRAAEMWRYWEIRYPDRKFIGPNVSQDGLDWLKTWRATYIELYGTAPRIYAMGVHCYMPADQCIRWVNTNLDLAQSWTTSGKVWITEWASLPCWWRTGDPVGSALADANKFYAFATHMKRIETVMWFTTRIEDDNAWWAFGPACNTALIDADEKLTRFGEWYKAVR